MSQTKEGAIKIAAKKIGISVCEYKNKIKAGMLWCTGCKGWHPLRKFNRDSSRWSGKAQSCRSYQKQSYRERYVQISSEDRKKPGPLPSPERHEDKSQARHRINVLVRTGKIPKANDLACSDCGHIHTEGEMRHEYDHHEGYSIGKHTVVIPLCSQCHHRRHPMDYGKRKSANNLKPQKGIKNGSAKINENTVRAIRINGKNGASLSQLATYFGISKSQVANIIHGRAWRHI